MVFNLPLAIEKVDGDPTSTKLQLFKDSVLELEAGVLREGLQGYVDSNKTPINI